MQSANIYFPQVDEIMPLKRKYLSRAGYKSNTELFPHVLETVREIYKLGLELAKPIVYYNTFDYNIVEHKFIPEKFKGIKKITFFASTLGNDIDNYIEKFYKKNEILKSVLLDAWGSEALEELNESFDKSLRNIFGKGTMRFSPGYGDLDITINKNILDFLNIAEIKVKNNTGILIPRKSTICMIGWYI